MKDPKRWLVDDCTPDEVRDLLQAAEPLPPFAGAAKAVATHAARQLAAHGTAVNLTSGLVSAKLSLVVLGVGVAASVGVGIAVATRDRPAQQVSAATPSAQPSALPRASSGPLARRSPAALTEPTPTTTPKDRPPTPPRATTDRNAQVGAGMGCEAALLERARRLLANDPTSALRLADEHARNYASGHLSLEREYIAVDALVRLGRSVEARQRAEGLTANDPGGLYTRRVQKLLGRSPTASHSPSQGR